MTGLEPAASGVTGRRSNQLSYTPKFKKEHLKELHLNGIFENTATKQDCQALSKKDTKFEFKSALLKIFALHLSSWRQTLFMLLISPIHTSAPKFER